MVSASAMSSNQAYDIKRKNKNNSSEAIVTKTVKRAAATRNKLTIDFDRNDFNGSPISDEGCSTSQLSPYSSSSDDDEKPKDSVSDSGIKCTPKMREKVARSSSSDSALGLDDEMLQQQEHLNAVFESTDRRISLTVTDIPLRSALLPVAEPLHLPESPKSFGHQSSSHFNDFSENSLLVPSKTLLKARIVEITSDIRNQMHVTSIEDDDQSTVNDDFRYSSSSRINYNTSSDINAIDEHNQPHIRYVRTPSVVVSDYSDDIMCGITLEEIEFFRQQRIRRGSIQDRDRFGSNLSAASSCSNLDYCGSTISAMDAMELSTSGLLTPEHPNSECSSCSTASCEDSTFPLRLTEALQRQQKKVSQAIILSENELKVYNLHLHGSNIF